MKLTVTSNADQVAARLERRARALPDIARDDVRASVRDALPDVQAATPVDTGELAASWAVRDTKGGADMVNSARHAPYQPGLVEGARDSIEAARKDRPSLTSQLDRKVP